MRRRTQRRGSSLVTLAEYVEEKRIHVVVQRLVIQKQLRQVAQVLTVDALLSTINLELRRM